MESYVEKFKNYVLAHLGRRAKAANMKISQLFLCFYLGETGDESQPLGVGYITGRGLSITYHVIKNEFEGEACFFQATKNGDKYEYEWSFHAENAAPYDSQEKAEAVIEALNLDDAEVISIGNSDDFAAWRKAFPKEYKKSEAIEYSEDSFDTIQEILNLKPDIMGLSQSVPPLILKSLYHISEVNEIDPEMIKVYVVANKEGTDISVHVYDSDEYKTESSLQDLIFSAMIPT